MWSFLCALHLLLAWEINLIRADFPSTQLNALSDLFNSTNGNYWDWKDVSKYGNHWSFNGTNIDPCAENWQGIDCVVESDGLSLVSNLTLPRYNLYGTIPTSISGLQSLGVLDLSGNTLFSTIPDSICSLANLTVFEIHGNSLTGSLPDNIGAMILIKVFNVRNNSLSSSLPPSMVSMEFLEFLDVGSNHFSGSILSILSQGLFGLHSLSLERNRFEGRLPSTLLSARPLLYTIDISENFFTGPFPTVVAPLSALLFLDFGTNSLNGTLPETIGMLEGLLYLNLSRNQFGGTIPSNVSNIRRLITLKIARNKIYGHIPRNGFNLSNLKDIDLTLNYLGGTLPEGFFNMTNLQNVQLANNSFESSIPVSLGNLHNLRFLDLGGNEFTGPIPNCFSSLPKLNFLYLQNNQLTNILPFSIYRIPQLVNIDLNDNLLTGTISPVWLSSESLSLFYVANNIFYGPIYDLINSLKLVVSLNVSNNAFDGSLPAGFGLDVLHDYSINNNQFTGNLLEALNEQNFLYIANVGTNYLRGELGGLLSLRSLQLFFAEGNHLSSTVAPSFSVHLEELWLSNNMLSGTISKAISQASNLSVLRLDSNRFTGEPPAELSQLANLSLLFLNSNSFRGSAEVIFDPDRQKQMLNIDISDNQFSQSLPTSFFTSRSLTSFAASSNCFTGTLSPFICNATTITALVLDAMSAAPACRVPIVIGFSSFALHDKKITGDIPECIFGMPNLQALHLSGNALTGKLSSDLYVSPSLQVLALAHNALVGELPSSILLRPWESLVLNVNRFRGILPQNMPEVPFNGSLYVDINRFSGPIPAQLVNATTIWVVQGNIFECNLQQSDIPTNDPKKDTYSCGSDSTNQALIVWGAVFIVSVIIILAVRNFDIGFTPSRMTRELSKIEQWGSVMEREGKGGRDQSGIVAIDKLFGDIKLIFVVFTAVAVLFCMPVYIALSTYYSTHSYAYVWTASALYLTGVVPSSCLWIVFSVVVVLRWNVIVNYLRRQMLRGNQARAHRHYWMLYILYTLVNVIVMIVVDVCYVVGINSLGPGLTGLVEIALAVFKLIWNEVYVMKGYLPLKKRFLSFIERHGVENGLKDFDDWRHNTWRWMRGRPPIVSSSRAGSLKPLDINFSDQRDQSLSQQNPIQRNYQSENISDSFTAQNGEDFTYHHSFPTAASTVEPVSIASMTMNRRSMIELSTIARDSSMTVQPNFREEEERKMFEAPTSRVAATGRDRTATETTIVGMESILESNDTTAITFNMVVNSLAVPAIAVLFVSPDCFYGIFFPPATVPGSFDYTYCANFVTAGQRSTCSEFDTGTQSISYEAPFTYSYTCSSDLVTYYAAAYFYQMIITALLLPLLKVFLKVLADRCKGERKCIKLQFRQEQRINHQPRCCTPAGHRVTCTCNPLCCLSCAKLSMSCIICQSSDEPKKDTRRCWWCSACWYNRYFALVNDLLPTNLRSLQEEPWSKSLTLFDQFFIPRMYTLFAAMMYYGIVFPPIAPAILLAAIGTLYFEEIVISRLIDKVVQERKQKIKEREDELLKRKLANDLTELDPNEYKPSFGWYLERLNEEADGIEDRFTHPWLMMTTLFFVTLFYAYLIYDSAADVIGYKLGILPSAAMFIVPIAIYIHRRLTSDAVLGESGRVRKGGIDKSGVSRIEANVNDLDRGLSQSSQQQRAESIDPPPSRTEVSWISAGATMHSDVEGIAMRGRGIRGAISVITRTLSSSLEMMTRSPPAAEPATAPDDTSISEEEGNA